MSETIHDIAARIESIIRAVPGVTFVSALATDSRRIHIRIDGGDDEQIAEAVYENTAGCFALPLGSFKIAGDFFAVERRPPNSRHIKPVGRLHTATWQPGCVAAGLGGHAVSENEHTIATMEENREYAEEFARTVLCGAHPRVVERMLARLIGLLARDSITQTELVALLTDRGD